MWRFKKQIKDSIYYHEDDFCQVTIVPEENALRLLRALSGNPNAGTDLGFETITIREEEAYPLLNLHIRIEDIRDILRGHAIREYDTVYTGYSSYREIDTDTVAYLFGEYALCIKTDPAGYISHIWLIYVYSKLEVPVNRMIDALVELAASYKLILVDWNKDVLVKLKREELENYFCLLSDNS